MNYYKPWNYRGHISPREAEILELISFEFKNQEIADKLFLSIHTVQTHRKNILRKLDVKNTAGMIRKGFELQLLDYNNPVISSDILETRN